MREQLARTILVLRARFGANLKARRIELGHTQANMAASLGIESGMVSQVECGVTALPMHNLDGWARVLALREFDLGEQFTYYNLPDVYRCLFDDDPYVIEQLPRPVLTARSAPGRPAAKRVMSKR